MAYPPILVDQDGNPIPQRWNEAQNKWEPYEGIILGPDGNPISSGNPLHVQAQGLETKIDTLQSEIEKLTALISDFRLKTEATLTGSIVDTAENAIRTKTVGLDWVSFDPFGETIEVPAGTWVRQASGQLVNGFGTLAVICRNILTGGAGRTPFRVRISWQSVPGGYRNSSAVSENDFQYDPDVAERAGLAFDVSTKSQYVVIWLFNDDVNDQTFHCHGMLRAS